MAGEQLSSHQLRDLALIARLDDQTRLAQRALKASEIIVSAGKRIQINSIPGHHTFSEAGEFVRYLLLAEGRNFKPYEEAIEGLEAQAAALENESESQDTELATTEQLALLNAKAGRTSNITSLQENVGLKVLGYMLVAKGITSVEAEAMSQLLDDAGKPNADKESVRSRAEQLVYKTMKLQKPKQ